MASSFKFSTSFVRVMCDLWLIRSLFSINFSLSSSCVMRFKFSISLLLCSLFSFMRCTWLWWWWPFSDKSFSFTDIVDKSLCFGLLLMLLLIRTRRIELVAVRNGWRRDCRVVEEVGLEALAVGDLFANLFVMARGGWRGWEHHILMIVDVNIYIRHSERETS